MNRHNGCTGKRQSGSGFSSNRPGSEGEGQGSPSFFFCSRLRICGGLLGSLAPHFSCTSACIPWLPFPVCAESASCPLNRSCCRSKPMRSCSGPWRCETDGEHHPTPGKTIRFSSWFPFFLFTPCWDGLSFSDPLWHRDYRSERFPDFCGCASWHRLYGTGCDLRNGGKAMTRT